jgi:hypothetical protein
MPLNKVGHQMPDLWLQVAAWTAKVVCIKSYLCFSTSERKEKHLLCRAAPGDGGKKQEKKNTESEIAPECLFVIICHRDINLFIITLFVKRILPSFYSDKSFQIDRSDKCRLYLFYHERN